MKKVQRSLAALLEFAGSAELDSTVSYPVKAVVWEGRKTLELNTPMLSCWVRVGIKEKLTALDVEQ